MSGLGTTHYGQGNNGADETRISLHPDNNDIRVWRGRAQRLHPNFIRERHYQQGGSVMFWGGIMFGRRTPLVPIQGAMTGRKYRDDILEPIVAPFAEHHAEEFTLMDDNARPHRHHIPGSTQNQANGMASLFPRLELH